MNPGELSQHALLFITFLINKFHLNNEELVNHAFQSVRDNPRDLQVLSSATWTLTSIVEANNVMLKYLSQEPQIAEFLQRWEEDES